MANTIIQIKNSGVTGNVPQSLQPGELAINYVDGKLFYGNSLSQSQLFDVITEPVGLNGELQFNDSGSFGSDSQLSFDALTKVLTVGSVSTGGLNVAPAINSVYLHANAAFDAANTGIQYGTSAGSYSNSAYLHANAAFSAANNATDTWVRNAANSASSYANSAYTQANTATTNAATADQRAVTSGSYANSAYTKANTASIDATSSGSYANSAYAKANNALANTTGTFAGSLTLTGNLTATSITTTGSSGDISGANVVYANTFTANTRVTTPSLQVTGDTTITGNLTVVGQTYYANTTTVNLGDNILTLNSDIPQDLAPSENAGIEVDRGSSSNVQLIWNESIDKWIFTNDGSNYSNIGSSAAESYANAAYLQANTATQYAESAGYYANSAFVEVNSAIILAQAAFDQANIANTTGSSDLNTILTTLYTPPTGDYGLVTENNYSSFGEFIAISYDLKTTFPEGNGLLEIDWGVI